MANLASTYRNQGRWKEAEELEVQVVEMRKRVFGQEHPSTLAVMVNLASTFRNQGRWKEVEDLEVQVVEARLKMYGQEHLSTLAGMVNLASTFRNQGRWKEVEDLEVQVVEASSRMFGQEHPSTLAGMVNLASTFRNQGRRKEAEQLEMQVVETSSRMFGQRHPSTPTCVTNLASTFRSQGRRKEAEELQARELKMTADSHARGFGTVESQNMEYAINYQPAQPESKDVKTGTDVVVHNLPNQRRPMQRLAKAQDASGGTPASTAPISTASKTTDIITSVMTPITGAITGIGAYLAYKNLQIAKRKDEREERKDMRDRKKDQGKTDGRDGDEAPTRNDAVQNARSSRAEGIVTRPDLTASLPTLRRNSVLWSQIPSPIVNTHDTRPILPGVPEMRRHFSTPIRSTATHDPVSSIPCLEDSDLHRRFRALRSPIFPEVPTHPLTLPSSDDSDNNDDDDDNDGNNTGDSGHGQGWAVEVSGRASDACASTRPSCRAL